MNNMKLNIHTTKNGFYAECEVDNEVKGYTVIGDNWDDLNPKKHGIDCPFYTSGKSEATESNVNEVEELQARITELEEQAKELNDLKELAGDIDIATAIETAKQTVDTETSEDDSDKVDDLQTITGETIGTETSGVLEAGLSEIDNIDLEE